MFIAYLNDNKKHTMSEVLAGLRRFLHRICQRIWTTRADSYIIALSWLKGE